MTTPGKGQKITITLEISRNLMYNKAMSISNPHLIKLAITLLIGVSLSWLIAFVYKKLLSVLSHTHKRWDKSFLISIHKPLQLFIWLMTLSFLIPEIMALFEVKAIASQHINKARQLIFIVIAIWFALRFVDTAENKTFIQDQTTRRAIALVARMGIIIVGILVVMQTLGISITALLALGGVGGLAIGFAAKDTLANFLGGMMIFMDRPFSVGDYVRSPDRNIEGTVEHIGWRLTRMRTFEKRPLYIPNGTFSTISIENYTRMSNRRINTSVGLRYQDANKIIAITKSIDRMLRAHAEIDQELPIIVNFNELGSFSLNILIMSYTKTTKRAEFLAVQQDVLLKTLDIIAQEGAECAFPTTTIEYANPTPSTKAQVEFDLTET